jgi:NitT/TauT family transport system permease protein
MSETVMRSPLPKTAEMPKGGQGSGEVQDIGQIVQESVQNYRKRQRRERWQVHLGQVAIAVIVLGAWQLAAHEHWINSIFYSSPSSVASFLVDNWNALFTNAIATFEATLLGFALGSIAGILVGLMLARWQRANRIVDPYLMALNSLPRIALVPLFLLWFGITFQAKVIQAITLVFFILLINTRVGILAVDPDLVLEGRLLHGKPRLIYMRILVPGALPTIASGLRLGVTYALLGVIASEMVASRNGLGQLITEYGQNLNSAGVFAALFLLAAIATALIALVRRGEMYIQKRHID